ncbi:MAG: hypothetical protein M0D55_01590 [Elusimicrobiota bacterium]|nr:MAG: hypothetical protein M0D55_01590 [Elusimicrobiota bacterium]
MARVHDQSTYSDGSPSASTGNVSAFTPVTSFIVDGTVPVSTATGITDGGYVNALTVLNGTHNGAMAGTDKVEIRITTNPVTGPDWTGSSYTFTTPYWTTATLAGLNWSYSDLTGAFTDNELYFIYVRATDLVGNVQSPVPVYGVRYDVTPPALSILFPNSPPANPAYSNNAESVRPSTYTHGLVSDSGSGASGIAQVWLGISSGAAQNVWWNEAARDFTTSQATVAWSTQTYVSGTAWQYSVPELQTRLADGVNYSVFVYARDIAGNTVNFSVGMLPGASAAGQTQPFKYDVTRPTSTVAVPVNGTAVNTLTAFSGSGTDGGSNASGVFRNYMAIRHVDGGSAPIGWWNWGTGAFDNGISDPPPAPPSAAWTQVSSTTVQGLSSLSWSTAVPAGMLESSATYRVVSAALDNATNLQQGATPVGSGAAFRYDVQIPTAVVATPAYGAYLNAATLGQLSGTANDELTGASGLQAVQILLKMENDQAYWNGGTAGTLADYDSTPGTKYTQWRTVTGTFNWTQAFPPMPAPSKNFRVWVRVIDRAGNISATPSNGQLDANLNADGTPARMFNYDDSPPVTAVSYPAQFVSFVPATITGTAQDTQLALNPSGIVDVRLRMTRTTGEYWNLFTSTWSATPLGFSNTSLTGINPWTFSNFSGAFVDGYRYDVNPQGVDAGGNVESPSFSTYSFIVDLSTPSSAILWPNGGAFVSSAAVVIRGVAEDRYCGLNPATCNASRQYESGMTSTMVAVAVAEVVVSTTWWDGAAFTSGSPIFLPAVFVGASSGTWTFAMPPSALTSTKYYKAVVRAKDLAGNIDVVTSTNTFVYDAAAPVAYATAPTGFNGLITTIYGTAKDDIPDVPSVVRLTIRETAPVSQYWNGTGWQIGPVELSSGVIGSLITGTTYAWSFDATTVNFINAATYTVTARGVDGAGNIEAAHGTPDIEFYLEAPTPSLVLTQPTAPDLKHYGPNSAGPVTTILGTGQNLRTTAGVRIALQRLTEPTSYWFEPTQSWVNDPATFTPVNVAGGTPQTWSLTLTNPYVVFDASYSLTATPVNNAGLLGTAVSRTFVFDRTIPLNGITNPASAPCQGANACLSSLPTISGTASDPTSTTPPSVTAAGVKVRLKNAVSGEYWNGTAFAPAISEMSIDPGAFSGGGPFAWSTATLAGAALRDGEDYTILAHAADKAANDQTVEAQMAAFTFIYDTSTPTGMLSQPSSGHVYLNLTTISGTSVDPGGANPNNKFSGVERVELQIFSPVDGVCWSNAASQFNVGCPNFFVVTGTTPWSYSNGALTGALVSGQPYTLTARAIDFAGNVQSQFSVPLSSRTMSADTNRPTTAFTKPLPGVAYRSSQLTGGTAITGSAADAEAAQYIDNDALQSVQTVIWYVLGGTSYYYTGVVDLFPSGNGTKFSSNTVEAAQWLNVTSGTQTWASLFAGADWISDRQYRAKARARDRARDVTGTIVGNLQNAFVTNVSFVDFKVDDTAPVSVVQDPPVTGFLQNLNSISGTSNSDLSLANTYYLRVWYVVGVSSFYWNGNAWGRRTCRPSCPCR